jgi:outer membrane protein assembly factor BamB
VALAVSAVLARFALPLALPDTPIFGMESGIVGLLGSVLGTLGIILWWLCFSRAPWSDRIGALVVMAAALVATKAVAHPSITGAGQGYLIYLMGIQLMTLALVLWAVASRGLNAGARRVSMAAALVAACGLWAIVRTDGVSSNLLGSDYRWRWTPTAEQLLLARGVDEPKPLPPAQVTAAPAETAGAPATPTLAASASARPEAGELRRDLAEAASGREGGPAAAAAPAAPAAEVEWPGFRGPGRDSVIRDLRINTDWSASPPTEIWRRAVGPGWSSFAVSGDLIYTQEQRGDDEIVSCYRLSTGEPVWRHSDPVRFYESNGGAGPRATPTIDGNRVFAHGATGIVNALDAMTGKLVWSRNTSNDTGRKVSDWGFSSSPLIIDDVVIVAAAGTLAGYDANTGELRWTGPKYGGSYSSPHRVTTDGVVQAVLLGGPGAISVDPATGAVLWMHEWIAGPIVQPAVLPGGDLVIHALTATGGQGTRRLHVSHAAGTWTVEERWTSNGLKPYFNDFVVHKGHAYGFDGNILSSISLEDGKRNWKGGRFGNGQMLLLADQDLLLVLSEDGELVLVSATPDKFTEVARFPALNAKTWNHPVLVGDVLLVRNGEEMVAFRLALATASVSSASSVARHPSVMVHTQVPAAASVQPR